MTSIKVISLDPGVTTGYAVGVITGGYMKVRCEQSEMSHIDLFDFLTGNHPDYIICERFDFRKTGRKQEGANLYPRELIGIVNYYVQSMARRDKQIELFMQMPKEQGGSAYFDDNKLKEMNVYAVGKEHGRSAMKHLLYWYTFGFGFQFNKREFGPWENPIQQTTNP